MNGGTGHDSKFGVCGEGVKISGYRFKRKKGERMEKVGEQSRRLEKLNWVSGQ